MTRLNQVDHIKAMIANSGAKLGRVEVGSSSYLFARSQEFILDHDTENTNMRFSVLHFPEEQVRCANYLPTPLGSNGTCLGDSDYYSANISSDMEGYDLIVSGCQRFNWQESGRCIYANNPDNWDISGADDGLLPASGWEANHKYLFNEMDILRKASTDLQFREIEAIDGNMVDSNIAQFQNVRYSVDVWSKEARTVPLQVIVYGESLWKFRVDGEDVATGEGVHSLLPKPKTVNVYLPAEEWVSLDLYYYAMDAEAAYNKVRIVGDLAKRVSKYAFPKPNDAPTLTSVSDGTLDGAIQLDWTPGYYGANSKTVIFVSGSQDQSATYTSWTVLDSVPIDATSYVDRGLDGDVPLQNGEIRYYALKHYSADGDSSAFSNVMSGSSKAFVAAGISVQSIVASGDSGRDSTAGTAFFKSSDLIQVTVEATTPLASSPDVWAYLQTGAGQVAVLADKLEAYDSGFMGTLHSIDPSAYGSANDGVGWIVISGTTDESVTTWNLSNLRYNTLPGDGPHAFFTFDNLGPTKADSSAVPIIEVDPGTVFDESGNLLAITNSVSIGPTTDSTTGRPNCIDSESVTSRNSGLYQRRVLNSGDGGAIGDWSNWTAYNEGEVFSWDLPNSDHANIVGGQVYVYVQFRDRALNTHDPVYGTIIADTVAPVAPTDLTVEGGLGVMDISWPKSTSVDVRHYLVDASNSPALTGNYLTTSLAGYPKVSTPHSADAATASFVDIVPGNTTRHYQITAVDWAGNRSTDASPVTSGTTVDTTPPDPPEWIDDTSNRLISWYDTVERNGILEQSAYVIGQWKENSEDDLAGYVFQFSQDTDVGWEEILVETNPTFVSGMFDATPGIEYTCRVIAYDTLGYRSNPSSELTIVASGDVTAPGEIVPWPDAASWLSGTTTVSPQGFIESAVDAQWQKPSADNDINRFFCEITVSGDAEDLAWTRKIIDYTVDATYNARFEGLTADTAYLVRCAAQDHAGNLGPYVSGSVLGGRDLTAPAAPTGLSATSLYEQVGLTWARNTEIDLSGYHLFRSDSDPDGNNEFVASGFMIGGGSAEDTSFTLDLDDMGSVAAGMMVSVETYSGNEDNVILDTWDSGTGAATTTSPLLIDHSGDTEVRVFSIRGTTYSTSFIDPATIQYWYNLVAFDSSGNISPFAANETSWVDATPQSTVDASIPYDFLASMSTVNKIRNSSFEVGSGTIDASERDMWWESKGTATTADSSIEGILVNNPFGDHAARLSDGSGDSGTYEQIDINVLNSTDYSLSAYFWKGSISGTFNYGLRFWFRSEAGSYPETPDWEEAGTLPGGAVTPHRITVSGVRSGPSDKYVKVQISGWSSNSPYGVLCDGVMFQEGNQITQWIPYSDEFVRGIASITGVEITSGGILADNIAANAILAKHILAGQIGTHHLTAMAKPFTFSFSMTPNDLGTYNNHAITWSGGSVVMPSGAGEVGDAATVVWIENTVPSGNIEFAAGEGIYYPYLEYPTKNDGGFFTNEPVAGATAEIKFTDTIANTVAPLGSANQKRLLGRVHVFNDTVTDMEMNTFNVGTIIDGDSIRTGSIVARSIAADAITSRHIQALSISGYHISTNTASVNELISAINNGDGSVQFNSNLISGVGDTDPPTNPSNLTATANADGSIGLTWTQSTDVGGGSVAGYKIYRADGEYATSAFDTVAYQIADVPPRGDYTDRDASLINGEYYTYWVTAYDDSLNETGEQRMISPGTPTGIQVSDTTAPDDPTVSTDPIFLLGKPGRVRVTWESPADDSDVAYYEVAVGETSLSTIARTRGTQYVHFITAETVTDVAKSNIESGGIRWGVRSVDRWGNASSWVYKYGNDGSYADMTSYQPSTDTAPAAVAGLSVTTDNNGGLLLSWTANSEEDIAGYIVKVEQRNNGAVIDASTFSITIPAKDGAGTAIDKYLIPGLEPPKGYPYLEANNIDYDIDMWAFNNDGVKSTMVSDNDNVVGDTSGPAAVTTLVASTVGNGVRLVWDDVSEADHYKVTVQDGVSQSTKPSTSPDRTYYVKSPMIAGYEISFVDTNLERETTGAEYKIYAVYAVDKFGNDATGYSPSSPADGEQLDQSGNWVRVDCSSYAGADDMQLWSMPQNYTYINGGYIYTGTIKADKIEVNHRMYDTNIEIYRATHSNSLGGVVVVQFYNPTTRAPFIWQKGATSKIDLSSYLTTNPFSVLSVPVPPQEYINYADEPEIYIVFNTDNEEFELLDGHAAYVARFVGDPPVASGFVFAVAEYKDYDYDNAHVWQPFGKGTTIDGDKIRTGYISTDRLEAHGITVEKLSFGNEGANVLNEYHSSFETVASGLIDIDPVREWGGSGPIGTEVMTAEILEQAPGDPINTLSYSGRKSIKFHLTHTGDDPAEPLTTIGMCRNAEGTWLTNWYQYASADIKIPDCDKVIVSYRYKVPHDIGTGIGKWRFVVRLWESDGLGGYVSETTTARDIDPRGKSTGSWYYDSFSISSNSIYDRAVMAMGFQYWDPNTNNNISTNQQLIIDSVMIEPADSDKTEASSFAPPMPTYIDGDMIRTGFIDADRAQIRNEATPNSPILMGTITEAGRIDGGGTIVGNWQNQTANGETVPPSGGVLIVHRDGDASMLTDDGLFRVDENGDLNQYGSFNFFGEFGMLDANDVSAFKDHFGYNNDGDTITISRFKEYFVPSGSLSAEEAYDWIGGTIGDGGLHIEAPKFVVSYLSSLTDEQRRKHIKIQPGRTEIMTPTDVSVGSPNFLTSNTVGPMSAYDFLGGTYEAWGAIRGIEYARYRVVARLADSNNFIQLSDTTFQLKVEAHIEYKDVYGVYGPGSGDFDAVNAAQGDDKPAIGTPAKGGVLTVYVSINV